MQWATAVGLEKRDREQTENRETNYRGPSNRHTDKTLRVGQYQEDTIDTGG